MEYLPEAKGKITTVRGEISVEYNSNEMRITIPENITAEVRLGDAVSELHSGLNIIKR